MKRNREREGGKEKGGGSLTHPHSSMSVSAFHILHTRRRKKEKEDVSANKNTRKDKDTLNAPLPLSSSRSPPPLSPSSLSPPSFSPSTSKTKRNRNDLSIYSAIGIKKPVSPKILIRDPIVPLVQMHSGIPYEEEDLTENVCLSSLLCWSFFFVFLNFRLTNSNLCQLSEYGDVSERTLAKREGVSLSSYFACIFFLS